MTMKTKCICLVFKKVIINEKKKKKSVKKTNKQWIKSGGNLILTIPSEETTWKYSKVQEWEVWSL